MRFTRATHAVAVTLVLALFTTPIAGQAPRVPASSPFDVIGFIEQATVDDPNDPLSGGTLLVNGLAIVVPRNTRLQMPATSLTWQQVFALAPPPYGPAQSGLALRDTPAPAMSYEVRAQGNRVVDGDSDRYIAGLLFIAQQSLNSGQGTINYIDYASGEMRVGGAIGDAASGARVRLNDPAGRFGRVMSPDPRFTIDEDNPSVRSETGFPMCIPRSDPAGADDARCPQRNRPADPVTPGGHLTKFDMPAPQNGVFPDARIFAPFEIGDYVTYSGILQTAAGAAYTSASSMVANVGIFTAPGVAPAYVAIDTVVLGVGGVPDPTLPQEATVRTVVEGFTTDPTGFIEVFAVDVDACSGAESDRFYDLVAVDSGAAVRGRWRWRPKTFSGFLPPTREVRASVTTGVMDAPLASGLVPGRYTAPNVEFIFPENLGIGSTPVPMNFQDFPFLAQGSGPYVSSGQTPGATPGPIVGQLSPWPGTAAPRTLVCGPGSTTRGPLADAGRNQSVLPRAPVTLNGSASKDGNVPALPLSFGWKQTAGPAVSLTGAATALPVFAAPDLAIDAPPLVLEFTMTVSNGVLSSAAKATVTVATAPAPPDAVQITTAQFRIRRSRLTVSAATSNPKAVLTLEGFGPLGPAPPAAGGAAPAPGTFQIIIVGVNPMPTSVTVTSSAGGTITVPVIVVP